MPERQAKAKDAHGLATVPDETGENSQQPAYELMGEWVDYYTKHGPPRSKKVILYFHGGGYAIFSAKSHRGITYRVSKETGARVFAVNYRLAPEDPFPAAVHDAFAAYLYLTSPDHPAISGGCYARVHRPYKPKDVIVMGDSAGGGLAMALMIYLRDYVSSTRRPTFGMVGGAMLMSPWVDLQCASESWHTNSLYDYLPLHPGSIEGLFREEDSPPRVYLLGKTPFPTPECGDPKDAPIANIEFLSRHPLASPIYADMVGLPPMLIQAGGLEVLRDECRLLAHRASKSGVRVLFELFNDMTHVWQAFPFLPAAKTAFARQKSFFREVLEKGVSRQQRRRRHPEAAVPLPASEWFIFDNDCEIPREAVEITELAAASATKLLLGGGGRCVSDHRTGTDCDSGVVVARDDEYPWQMQTVVDGTSSDEESSSEIISNWDASEGNPLALGAIEAAEMELTKPRGTGFVWRIVDTPLEILASATLSLHADIEARCQVAQELMTEGERFVGDIEFNKAISSFDVALGVLSI